LALGAALDGGFGAATGTAGFGGGGGGGTNTTFFGAGIGAMGADIQSSPITTLPAATSTTVE
jgi:hypothetical protein